MTTVTINGHTYTDDADPPTGFANGGHRVRFVPALSDVVAVAAQVASNALVASNAAASAVTGASTSASSTTSLAIGTGSKSLTIETGKNIVIGMTVKIAVTADGTQWMAGDVTAYTSGSGALVVNVTTTQGSGTFAAWTVSLSGPPGAGIPSMTGNSGRFLTNNGTSANWSATIVEAGGRIGIGRTPTTYKLEVQDDQNGICGLNQINNDTGALAESRQAATTNAGATYLRQVSTAGGGWGGCFSSASAGSYFGSVNAAKARLMTNNTVRVEVHESDGSVNFTGGAGALRLAGHITRFESATITLQTGAAVYAAVTHGGTRMPDFVQVVGRMKVANNGWAIGHEVDLTNIDAGRSTTQIFLTQNVTPTYKSATTGALISGNAANLDIVVRVAWK